ncbi:MAG: FGGY family carbohydrate kinase, partial [Devosia sp.]
MHFPRRAASPRQATFARAVDAWLVFNLTGGEVHATDFSNASRTQLFDIRTGSWSPELASTFDVPLNILPEPRASD